MGKQYWDRCKAPPARDRWLRRWVGQAGACAPLRGGAGGATREQHSVPEPVVFSPYALVPGPSPVWRWRRLSSWGGSSSRGRTVLLANGAQPLRQQI